MNNIERRMCVCVCACVCVCLGKRHIQRRRFRRRFCPRTGLRGCPRSPGFRHERVITNTSLRTRIRPDRFATTTIITAGL